MGNNLDRERYKVAIPQLEKRLKTLENRNQEGGFCNYLVETGTNNGWHYRKYRDGHYEAWRYYSATGLNLTTASGGTYYSASAPKTLDLPSFSTGCNFATGTETTPQDSGVYIYAIGLSDTSISVDYRAHASQSNTLCGGNFYVQGTWE